MKKTITETLKAFATNPIEAEKVYHEKNRRWYLADTQLFWDKAMHQYADAELKATANRLIKYLYENDLIRFDYVLDEFLSLYRDCNYDCDTGLRTYAIDYIADCSCWWLDDAEGEEADELRKAVADAEQVWYWPQLMAYCVDCADWEYGFMESVINARNF